MNDIETRKDSMRRLRRWTFLFPPMGVVCLWREARFGWALKIFGSLFAGGVAVIYVAVVCAVLVRAGLLQVEWRGGYAPSLTSKPTLPDYDAVERHRGSPGLASPSHGLQHLNASAATASTPYWTRFRGPLQDGHYHETTLRTNWTETAPRLVWRQPIGGGYASFVVAHGLAYTIEQRRKEEAVTAYDMETGKQVWAHAYYGLFEESMGGEGPRATPAYHEGHIFSLGALGTLKCLNATNGHEIWTTNILLNAHASLPYYGCAASPLVVGDAVIVAAGGAPAASVVAYHRRTSARLWGSLDDGAAYSSPILAEIAGVRQILVATENRVVGLDPKDGRLLWEHPWVVKMGNRNIAQPLLVGANRIFLSASYGTGCEMIEISAAVEGKQSASSLWKTSAMKNKFTSSVLDRGHIYGLDEDRLACVDPVTGARLWKEGRYGYGQLLVANGHLIVLTGDGDVALVRARPDRHEELARIHAIRGKTWNQHAIADGRLLVRNAVEMACFDLR